MTCLHLCIFYLFVLVVSVSGKSRHRQVTVEVMAGSQDCFFIPDTKVGQTLDISYQVTSSSHATGKNDITVRLYTPAPHNLLYERLMDSDGSYNMELQQFGDYKLCLDNQVSTWSDKIVWFEVSLDDPEDDYEDDDYLDDDDWDKIRENDEDTVTVYEMKVEDIKTKVHDVRIHLGKMRHFQFMLGAQSSKDSKQMEANLSRLNFWSLVHMSMMIIVGVIQVIMVRQLFTDKSMVQKLTTRT